jgi:site-specific DNA recombinase
MTVSQPQRAGIYTRMSLAIMNDPAKVEDQARISRELAVTLHWDVADGCGHPGADGVYTDNSRSAWRKDRKRPAWDQMLADIKAGRLDSVIVYHGDRLVRQPYDLETLINLADGKGVRLASPTGMRDLDNTDDRFVLRILVAQACMESDNTSRRRKAQYERWRREGRTRPGGRGGRAFGFATDGVTQLPDEAEAIRAAAARLLAGEPTGAIARDMTAAGWHTPAGGPFTHGMLRKMLARPRYAGLMPDGQNKGAWEPVLDRETWEAVCAVLDARAAGFGYATNARKWLLSGIARCGACGSGLQVRMEQRRTHLTGYGCVRPGCRKVQRSAALLDEYVIARVVAKLGDAASPPGRLPPGPAAGEFRALAQQRAEVEAMLADHTKGRADLLMKRLDSIDARLGQLRELAASDAGARLLRHHAGITIGEFRGLPLATQRALVAACFTITVLPASRRGPGFNTQDVKLGTP